jgi:putative drug exporter of the RND superfamily
MTLLTRVATAVTHSPRLVLVLSAIIGGLLAVAGASAPSHLSSGGFVNPSAPSSAASYFLERDFKVSYGLTIVVHSPAGANDARARRVAELILSRLRLVPQAYGVTSYWTEPSGLAQHLISPDGKDALINVQLSGDVARQQAAASVVEALIRHVPDPGRIDVKVGGEVPAISALTVQANSDLARSLIISIPALAILLLLIFGSVAASLLPLAISGVSLAGALAALRLIAFFTPVSVFALNMASGIALALAIDYSLLLVNRFREETRAGRDQLEAVIRTVQTAGRTILFSALALVLCLSALLVFPMYAVTSIAYAGVAVVAVAAAAAILVAPAALALFGPSIEKTWLSPFAREGFRSRRGAADQRLEQSFWYRAAGLVMRHPVALGLLVIEFLIVAAVPFLGVRFGPPDDRVLPPTSQVRQVGDVIRAEFQPLTNEVIAVMPDRVGVPDHEIASYARSLSALPRVIFVLAPTGQYQGGSRTAAAPRDLTMSSRRAAYLTVYADGDAYGAAGTQVVSEVERVKAPAPVVFGGATPSNGDMVSAIRTHLPAAIGIIVLSMFLVVFMFTGSLLLPVKAIVASAMSLAATFGAMVWIFQDGHLLGYLFGNTASGFLIPQTMILIFVISFGISMDYEIFLLSRIREEWMRSPRTAADNAPAVQVGLARAGGIITAAALVMSVVFATMTTARLSIIQMFGLGLSVAVVMDATLIRGILVPAIMRVAGLANWWLPAWLRRWHFRRAWSDGNQDIDAERRSSEAMSR